MAQAAAQWEKAKRAIDAQRPLLEESAAVLKAHFQRSDTSTYRDRIALVSTPGKLILDQPKVREFLGAKLARFQKRTEPSQSLTLLK